MHTFRVAELEPVFAKVVDCVDDYTPETKFGGVYRSHPVVGRAVGRSVQRSVAFSFSNTTSYNDQAHGEKVQCTRKITPS